ncbi:hypothetical protein vBVpaS1601_61 [Vibrio phage vB_VpaS_1601]|uniref:hypothetical protein n=1 Tax=Vibrio phage SHOU24 TaxID=1414739 RepID=UPI0003ED214C|nr:hypothetical protein SHOU24_20 [Vibrio phage SHOU24]AHI61217.1 hypothetical protein SHOU24_20 [Vibrio phage SHOU24]WHM52754.1 hypothetical protein vBVpaP1601_61 [Vibrio phage vB_VpaP_1601]
MKRATILLLLPFFASAESVSNSESSSYSSGANINNQTVINESSSYLIEDVRCPVPTLGLVGGTSQVTRGSKTTQNHIGVGLTIPLLSGKCDEAVRLKIRKMEFDLADRERLLTIKEQSHIIKMLDSCNKLGMSKYECNELID